MAAICQSFVQNAWKKDLCSNCFKSREEHGKSNSITSSKPRYLSPSTTLTGRGLYAPAGSWKEIVIQTQSSNGRRGNDGTVSPPSSCASPQSPQPLSNTEYSGILKSSDQRTPRRKNSGVCFPEQVEHVIGYGGCENGSDDDEEYFSGDDISGDETEHDLTEEERMLFRLTKKNTDFNSVKSNLMKDPDTPAPEPLTKRAFAQLLLAASRTPSGAPENKKNGPPLVSVKPFVRDSVPGELRVSLVSPMINGELINTSKRPSFDEDDHKMAENEQVKENNAVNCVVSNQNGEIINCNNHNGDFDDDSDNGEMIVKDTADSNHKMKNGEVDNNKEKEDIIKVEVSINLQQKNVTSGQDESREVHKNSDTDNAQPQNGVEAAEKKHAKDENDSNISPPVEGKQLGTPRSSFLHGIIGNSNTSESAGKPPILRDKPRLPVKPTKPLRETEQRPQKSLKQRVEEDLREKLRQKEEEERQKREEDEKLAREKEEKLAREIEVAERLALEKHEQEEAERVEQEKRRQEETERLAEEKRKEEETERLAEEKRKREETERILQETLKKEEAEKIAQEKQEQEEEAQRKEEQKRKEEAEKVAQEKLEQEEIERLAEEEREAQTVKRLEEENIETERVACERREEEVKQLAREKIAQEESGVVVLEGASDCSTSETSDEAFECKDHEKEVITQEEKKTEIQEIVKHEANDSENKIYLDVTMNRVQEVVNVHNGNELHKESSAVKERRPSLMREFEDDPNAGKRSVGKRQAPRPPIPMLLQDSGPESATSSASTTSLSSLSSPGSPDDMPASAEDKKRGRFSLKRLLRLGSGGSREEERRSTPRTPTSHHPPPRPEIIHPLDRNSPGVEVIRGTSRDVQRRLMSEQRAGRPKPPPPPRWVDGGSPPKPARPPPPRSGDLLKQQGNPISSPSYSARNVSPEDNVYANIACFSVSGTGRTGLAPHKPQRSSSLRETAQGSNKRRDSDTGYDTLQGAEDENPYEVVRVTGARNRYIKNPRAAFSLRRRSCEGGGTTERPSTFSRSVSLPLGSEALDDSQLPDVPSPWRTPRAAIPRTMDDSYSAISAANHEALAFVLEQVSGYPPAIPPALRGLRGSGLRWADFSVDSSSYMQVGPRVFIQASWGPHPVTLLLSTAPDRGTLPPRSPHAPPAMAEFTDTIPGSFLCQNASEVQAFVSVLPELEVETLGTFAASRLGGIPLEVPADVQDAMFILLQLIHTLKLLQARGVEDSSPANEVALLRGMTDDSFRLVFLGDSGESKSTLCRGALDALYLLLGAFDGEVPVNMPFRDAVKAVITTLSEERAGSLSRAKSVLESILWGPVASPDCDEAALQRWLDVERAAALGGALRWGLTVSAPSIREELHLVFLVRACTRTLRECTVSS